MFEVQFRQTHGGVSSRWSCHWATEDGRDAADHLMQMTLSVPSSEWRMVWSSRKQVPSAQRRTKLLQSA